MPAPVLALIGCGAISEAFYIPALEKRPDLVSSLILVDMDAERVEALRSQIGAAAAITDFREILDQVDGAIIAAPHHLHTPLSLEFIDHGVHVLSEKPLSSTLAEVDQIISAATEKQVTVSVNHTRRLENSMQEAQRLTASGAIGELREIDCALGSEFGWPATTNTYFGTAAGGRGVLYDLGPHILDLVCWFMGAKPDLVSYADDSSGGTEAVAKVSLRHGAATAQVHLSWLSELRNTFRVTGTEGSVEVRVYNGSVFTRRDAAGRSRTVRADKARDFIHYGEKLLANFTEVIAGRAAPIISAEDVRASVALIDECYGQRTRLAAPWFDAYERLANV